MVAKIVSGGQTGVDRAALDVAIRRGIDHGGYCPRGRRAEDGVIPARYALVELESDDYAERTERNVIESDATLVIRRDEPSAGTDVTIALAYTHRRPLLVCDPRDDVDAARSFLHAHRVVNVAGPRESEAPGIGEAARSFLENAIAVSGGT